MMFNSFLFKTRISTAMLWAGLIGLGLFGSAQRAEALKINPARQEVNLAPGESVEGAYQITNETPDTVTVKVVTKKYFELAENKGYAPEDWLRIKRTEFVLKTGESETVPFSISVPKGDKKRPGPRGFLMAMASFMPRTDIPSSVNLVMTVPIYVTIRGTEKPSYFIQDFELKKIQSSLMAVVNMQNNGNIYTRPKGRVEVKNKDGQTVQSIEIENEMPVFPGKPESFTQDSPWPDWPNGPYKAVLTMTVGPGQTLQKDFPFEFNKDTGITKLTDKDVETIWKK